MPTTILIFGATGLMMGHLLPHLMKNPELDLTAYARPGSKGIPFLRKIGMKIIEATWDDSQRIRSLVNKFDIVWDSADSHDPSLPQILVPALIDGPKQTTFLRFSGTGNWITQTGGNLDESARLYDDSSAADIASVTSDMFNGAGDLLALEALKKGVDTWILCTGGIYGIRPDDIPSASVFVRLYTNNALELGYTPYIGEGTAHMQLLHIDDFISACDIFLAQVLNTRKTGSPTTAAAHERFFIAPGYSVQWKRIAETWSRIFKDNFGRDIPVRSVSFDQAGFVAALINAEMKSKPTRLTQLGWTMRGPDIEESLPQILFPGSAIPLP